MRIAYLFGAGASAGAVPIVKNIPTALAEFKETFIAHRSGSDERIKDHPMTVRELEEDFLIALDLFLVSIPKHASIDTYAKKLRITGQATIYSQLKSVFSAFLIYTQLIKEVDRRYDSFFASILGIHSSAFISDMTILTWNYDFQLEKAYSAFSKTNSLESNQAMLNVSFPGWDRFNNKSPVSVFKLNGTAGFIDSSWRDHYTVSDELTIQDQRKFFSDLIQVYSFTRLRNTSIHSSLTFAWDNENSEFYKNVVDKVKGIEILVVIGYSIPFFNRIIDRKIIQAMAPSIKRVYIQDINPDNVMDSLTSIWLPNIDIPVKIISSVEQFYLPPQL